MTSVKKEKTHWSVIVGALIFGGIVALSLIYTLDPGLQNQANYNLFLILSLPLGALSGFFVAWQHRKWHGMIAGILAGAGAFGLFDYYMVWFHKSSVYKWEVLVVCLVGVIPGVALYKLLKIAFPKREEKVL